MQLLIVEDSLSIYERLTAMLQEIAQVQFMGYAKTESEAMEIINHLTSSLKYLDAAILDIQLAEGSGISILKHIKRHTPKTMVIMLTNHVTPQYRELCAREGAEFFFDKSTEFMRVPEVLSRAIDQKMLEVKTT